MKRKGFGVFILTNGRPDRVITYETIRRQGYTGPIWIVIDDDDPTGTEYRKRYGAEVISFSKAEIAKRFDEADNFYDRRSIVYARNACFDLAKKVGLTSFLQLDDDYRNFVYRFDGDHLYTGSLVYSLDALCDAMVDWLEATPALTVAFSQGGDHIGGGESHGLRAIRAKRKAMNTFFCLTDRRFDFVGRINEDVNTYVGLGRRGGLFLTLMSVQVNQTQTQSNEGGMTELYVDSGTYVKTFYTVMFAPSCVKISTMGRTHRRIHHRVRWRNAVPVILRAEHKKGRAPAARPIPGLSPA